MFRPLLFAISFIVLSSPSISACSCLAPSTFCESISFEDILHIDFIVRGKVVENTSPGKEVEVVQLIFGELEESKFTIVQGDCTLFFQDLEVNSEYVIAVDKNHDQHFLYDCGISFLKIENEEVGGNIAPGVNRIKYNDLHTVMNCGGAFDEFGLSNNLKLFPNPTEDAFRIHNESNERIYENLAINVFDAAGRKMGSSIKTSALLPNEEWMINIQDFAKGVYFVQVSNAVQHHTYKMIKL